MVDQAKSWLKENSTLATFLVAQLLAMGAAAAAIIAYSVKLETRVSIMETRGAEYTVARMEEMKQRITILEQKIDKNAATIERVVAEYLKDLRQQQPQPR
jgi:ERCC4-type nuclease